jgi:hypothetical protein
MISPFVDIISTILVLGIALMVNYVAKKIGTVANYNSSLRAAKSLLFMSGAIVILGLSFMAFNLC